MKLLRSCKLNILQWRINPKYAFVAMYMVLYMWYETQGFVAYSRALEEVTGRRIVRRVLWFFRLDRAVEV